jgi:hypothetical protein
LDGPEGIAVFGSDLFVASYYDGTVAEYGMSGATVNAALVSGLNEPIGIAVAVNTPPVITTNPTSQSVSPGSTASFAAAASGTPTPTVQWQISTNGGNTFTNISGATNTPYSFNATAAESGDEYQAVFTNSQGSATSSAATLTVSAELAAPTITTNPASQSVVAGNTATFAAAATGNPTPTVQWQISTNGGSSFSNISGATTTTYDCTAAASENGDQYRALFTNSQGSATTKSATLTVNPGSQPTEVSGVVYNDRSGDGTKTRKDAGMPNITVTLQKQKRGRPKGHAQSVTTDANGNYSFTNLTAGDTYQISEIPPRGYTITQPSTGVDTINLSAGQDLTGENFGDHRGAKGGVALVMRPSTPFATGGSPATFAASPGGVSALLFANQDQQGVFAD